jgi:hypothetical protein
MHRLVGVDELCDLGAAEAIGSIKPRPGARLGLGCDSRNGEEISLQAAPKLDDNRSSKGL